MLAFSDPEKSGQNMTDLQESRAIIIGSAEG
jgi:hypothetical protein